MQTGFRLGCGAGILYQNNCFGGVIVFMLPNFTAIYEGVQTMEFQDMSLKTTIAAAATLFAFAMPASAATLQLTAEAKFDWQSSDFSIVFDDADDDGTLSLDEIVSFSGFQNFQLSTSYSEVLRVPVIANIADGEIFTTSSGLQFNTWVFGEGTSGRTTAQATSFDYSVGPIAAVPLPASGVLLIAGLGGLAFARRRNPA